MTRKDFEAIAVIVAASGDRLWLATKLSDYLETRNPNFDRVRFLRACGL